MTTKYKVNCKLCGNRCDSSDWLAQEFLCLNPECALSRKRRRSRREKQVEPVITTPKTGKIVVTYGTGNIKVKCDAANSFIVKVEVPNGITMHIRKE
jgi:hypothetical protein